VLVLATVASGHGQKPAPAFLRRGRGLAADGWQ